MRRPSIIKRSTHDERGAALVEMAFVLVLLVTLLVGTITSAVAYGRDNSVQNAAREASRFAATLPGAVSPVPTTWFDDVRTVAQAAAVGDLDPAVPGRSICVAVGNGTTWESMTYTTTNTGTSGTTECYADGRGADEGRVQVVVSRDTSIQAVIFTIDVSLNREAVARYER